MRTAAIALTASLVLAASPLARQATFRTLDDKYSPPRFTDAVEWKKRAAYLREHILTSAGLLPMPERAPLAPEIFGKVVKNDYTVEKVYFQSLPGFLVTGNLYRPIGTGPFPAVLAPHGHWAYGRLENTALNSVPGRAINLARQGFVVFTYDMIGYDDSRQLPHTFGGTRETLWGMSLAGLQLWNSIRSLDFLQSLPDVQKDALAVTGESGGGTQTFLLTAVDDRVKVAVPVNMISLHMQGGCLCENPPALRLDTNNVEIAATSRRPLLMVSATGTGRPTRWKPSIRRSARLLAAGRAEITSPPSGSRPSTTTTRNRARRCMRGWRADERRPADVRSASDRSPPTPRRPAGVPSARSPARGAQRREVDGQLGRGREKAADTRPISTHGPGTRHSLGFGDVAAPTASKPTVIRTCSPPAYFYHLISTSINFTQYNY
jgi:hypothetical protein